MTDATHDKRHERQLADEMARLREEVVRLKGDIAAIGEALKDVADSARESATERLAEQTEQAHERINQGYERTVSAGKDIIGDMERKITEKPLASLLAAAGIGFIVAKLLDLGSRR